MKTMILAAGAAALALTAGSALAGGKAKGPAVAGPKQPIPYSQLGGYLKASPKQRASKEWGDASTGAAANTSATARTMPNDTPSGAPTPDTSPPSNAVNPTPNDPATGAPPPPMDTTAPRADNPDQGKGEMANPATDRPH
jgi:hypothetical protein